MGRAHLVAAGRPVADLAGRPHRPPPGRPPAVRSRGDRRSRSSGCSCCWSPSPPAATTSASPTPSPEVTVTTSPRSLARAVGHEVRSHADVVSASVVASSKKVVVKAGTLDAPDEVRAAVRERIDDPVRPPPARAPTAGVGVRRRHQGGQVSRRSRAAVARSAAGDRTLVLLSGLVLLAVGVLVVLLGAGIFGVNRAQRPADRPADQLLDHRQRHPRPLDRDRGRHRAARRGPDLGRSARCGPNRAPTCCSPASRASASPSSTPRSRTPSAATRSRSTG